MLRRYGGGGGEARAHERREDATGRRRLDFQPDRFDGPTKANAVSRRAVGFVVRSSVTMAQQNDDEASVDPYAEELTFQEISHLNDRKVRSTRERRRHHHDGSTNKLARF